MNDGGPPGVYTITVEKSDLPGAPRSLRATLPRGVGNQVTLFWSAPVSHGGTPIIRYDFAQYSAEEAENPNFTPPEVRWTNTGDDLSHSVPGLTNGTTYYFQVRAVNGNGAGTGSAEASATAAGPPAAPLNPSARSVGNGRVELSWGDPLDVGNPISSYEYQQRSGTSAYGSWRNIPNSGKSTRFYTVTGLTNGRTYWFNVRAKNVQGTSQASRPEMRAVPQANRPGAPTNLSATAGDEQVRLSWTASPDGGEPITRYEYRKKEEQPFDDPDPTVWTTTGGTGTAVTVQGLVNRTTYYFQVRAVSDLGCSATDDTKMDGCGQESLQVPAMPIGRPVTHVNLNLIPSDEDSRVTLTWTVDPPPADPPPADPPPADVSGFQYRQKTGGDYGSWIDVRNSDASFKTHVVSGLMNGTTYTFEVRAVNSSGGGGGIRRAVSGTLHHPGRAHVDGHAGRRSGEADVDRPGRWRQAHHRVQMPMEDRRRSLRGLMRRQIARRVGDVAHPH